MSDFHEHLLEPTAKKRKRFVTDDPKLVNPPIPWEDGEFEKFINISEDGTTVSFKLQKGTFKQNGWNGCYPIQIVRFAHQLYKNSDVKDRETSQITTNLEDALLHDIARSVRRSQEKTHGHGNTLITRSAEDIIKDSALTLLKKRDDLYRLTNQHLYLLENQEEREPFDDLYQVNNLREEQLSRRAMFLDGLDKYVDEYQFELITPLKKVKQDIGSKDNIVSSEKEKPKMDFSVPHGPQQ